MTLREASGPPCPGAVVQSCSRLVKLQHGGRTGIGPRHCRFRSCQGGPFTAHLHPTLWHLGLRPDALGFPHSHRPITHPLGLWAPPSQGLNLSRSPLQLPVARSSEVSRHRGLAHPAPPRPLPTPPGPLLACVQPASFFWAGLSVVHVRSTPFLSSIPGRRASPRGRSRVAGETVSEYAPATCAPPRRRSPRTAAAWS